MRLLFSILAILITLPQTRAVASPALGLPIETAPNLLCAGERLGRSMLMNLEHESILLRPGPVSLVVRGNPGKARWGLENVLRRRGFNLEQSLSRGRSPVLSLGLSCSRDGGLSRVQLECMNLDLGPWLVEAGNREWVGSGALAAGQLRCKGFWEGSKEEALASARRLNRGELSRYLTLSLPWRPWRDGVIGESLEKVRFERDHFLERENGITGSAWRAWLLAKIGPGEMRRVESMLNKEDKRWFLRIGSALLAGLLIWALASRLDWATRGYFTLRVRMLGFLLWIGVCGLLGIMV